MKIFIIFFSSIILASNLNIAANNELFLQQPIDSSKSIEKTKYFLKWYKIKLDEINIIQFVKLVGSDTNEHYRINYNDVKKYIIILKNSMLFSTNYLENKKKYFDSIDNYLLTNKQNIRPISGLAEDLILYTQEPEEILNNISKLSFTIFQKTNKYIIVEMSYVYFVLLFKFDQNYSIENITPVIQEIPSSHSILRP